MEKQGFEIMRALPKEIQKEVLSFHSEQHIRDNEREWKEQHFAKFRDCLTEMLILTRETIGDCLEKSNFSSTRYIKIVEYDLGTIISKHEYIVYLDPHAVQSKIYHRAFSESEVPIWGLEYITPNCLEAPTKEELLGILDEWRKAPREEWSTWALGRQ
jgi:hypothetical protein